MPSFEQLERSFQELDRGVPRLTAMRDAIHEADQQQDMEWMFWFRYDYLEESIFCGDRYYAMIIFPELLSIYDKYPKLQENPRICRSMLVAFKWIVEAAPEFPQVSRAEIDSYFRLFKRRLIEQGCSLSIYYMKRSLFYMHVDRSIAAMCFYRFVDAPLDSISDGKALYYDQQVQFYLFEDDEVKALKAAEQIFSGKLKSNSLPQATYHDFIRYYLYKGNFDEASRYARMTEHRVTGDPYYLDVVGTLMSLYSVTDPAQGAALFNKNYPVFAASKNPWLRMLFLIGAAHLTARFAKDGAIPESFCIPPELSVSGAEELAAWFDREAADNARKFDDRNGTDDYTQMLRQLPI
ncbi:MAG: hypothetical protein K5695_17160 [Oscillospiraceae bacterium]|nr:hypothetical protein [Oscillospiraceae bacterium]